MRGHYNTSSTNCKKPVARDFLSYRAYERFRLNVGKLRVTNTNLYCLVTRFSCIIIIYDLVKGMYSFEKIVMISHHITSNGILNMSFQNAQNPSFGDTLKLKAIKIMNFRRFLKLITLIFFEY